MDSGPPVHIGLNSCAISGRAAPWSFLWSIHGPLALRLIVFQLNYFTQYAVYAFPSPVFLKQADSLKPSIQQDGFIVSPYGLSPNGKWQDCSAMAIVQGALVI